MRVLLVPLLALVGAGMLAPWASADNIVRSRNERELRTRAAKVRNANRLVTSAAADPETVWIGHVSTGGYGPHKIGRGPRRIIGGLQGNAAAYDGVWDFDHFQGGETDSLQGWWPIQPAHSSIGPSNLDDFDRAWFGLDGGNLANYVPPQGSPKRTFGVTGIWHADNGTLTMTTVPGKNPVAPGWAPIAGTRSAWCGIRSHGDITAVDATGTGNPINDNLAQYNGENSGAQFASARSQGTDHNFPGYGSQWDQMMYRDIDFGTSNVGGSVTVAFKYVVNMSTKFNGDHASQTGYFYFDPIKECKTSSGQDGNFISAAQSQQGPVDSFMVYIGAPVDEAAAVLSDGSAVSVYDPQRRWLSEVIKTTNLNSTNPGDGLGSSWRKVLSRAGAGGTTAAPIVFSRVFTANDINSILDADGGTGNGGKVRLVFRVKTNRGYDDETNGSGGFSSGGTGAAIVDDVTVTGPGGTMLNEGFEGTNGGFDNAPGASALTSWRSTGKPPPVWFHVHDVDAGLPFNDPCGAITSAVRLCNMGNNVLVPGDHDAAEKPGGFFGGNFQDALKWAVSPTINLVASGEGVYNGMGIDTEIASRRSLVLFAEQMLNLYGYDDPPTGNGWRLGWQSYPATQPNGVKCWGEMRKSGFFTTTGGVRGCGGFTDFQSDGYDEQMIRTTNPSGTPDSVRAYIEAMSRCFTLPITQSTCSPAASGTNSEGYWDNISIGLVTAPPPPQLGVVFGTVFNDCFPVNSQNRPAGTPWGVAHDTLAANIRSGYNIALNGKQPVLTGPNARENIPGDSTLVSAQGENVRMDMVFRILPGVGNYVQLGNRASGVARRPDTVPRVAAAPGDATNGALTAVDKFWGTYMANNGQFGTANGHFNHTAWDPNTWNSAQIDTVERNFFPMDGLFSNSDLARLTPGTFMSDYHESEPKYTVLGIAKNRCFLNKDKQPVKVDQTQIHCGNLGGGNPYPPIFYYTGGAPVAGTGLTASEGAGLTVGRTYEYTKIIPDGQLTPGAHIEYFFRKSLTTAPLTAELAPDTNFILPNTQNSFGYFDGARWSHASVLPDRWKDPAFGVPGATSMACMLVIDYGDRRGDEIIWVSVADSIGLTTVTKRGAHNGWRARPDQDITANVGSDDTICRRDNGGQAGSMWDLYQVVSGESNIQAGRLGSRDAAKDGSPQSLTTGRSSTHGPSEDMLKSYRSLILLMADIGVQAFGPFVNQTDNDIGSLTAYLTVPGGAPTPRGLAVMGYDAGEAFARPDEDINHNAFMIGHLRASLRFKDYRAASGNPNDVMDLTASPPVAPTGGYLYGSGDECVYDLDVFNAETPGSQAVAHYENVGGAGPYVGSVFATDVSGTRPYRTLINGWTLGIFGQGFGVSHSLENVGKRHYIGNLLSLANAFGALTTCGTLTVPVGVGDMPNGNASAFMNFLNLKSSNPMKSGQARIAFGLAKTEKVEVRMYDVSGRQIKTVANRVFTAGTEHVVFWDGTNDLGQRVKSGVYFYQLRTPSWTSQKKLAVLAN